MGRLVGFTWFHDIAQEIYKYHIPCGICLLHRGISLTSWKEMGFVLSFITTAEGTYPFIERDDFVVPTCFNMHVSCGNLFWLLREFFLWNFVVLNLGKQKGYNSFWWSDKNLVYVSAEASGSNKRHISFSWDLRVALSCCCSVSWS